MAKGEHDQCYYSVKSRYATFPSARASQAIAKCRKRKGHGHVRKSESGSNLKRWGKERWVNTKTGRPCGNSKDKSEYCRPSKRVNGKTPVMRPGKKALAQNQQRKAAHLRAKSLHRR